MTPDFANLWCWHLEAQELDRHIYGIGLRSSFEILAQRRGHIACSRVTYIKAQLHWYPKCVDPAVKALLDAASECSVYQDFHLLIWLLQNLYRSRKWIVSLMPEWVIQVLLNAVFRAWLISPECHVPYCRAAFVLRFLPMNPLDLICPQ